MTVPVPGNIQDILGAASHLQIQPIVEACSSYLSHQLDLENCVDILTIADTYSLLPLRQLVYCYIGQNLDKLACLQEFQHMSAHQLHHFLQSDFPINCREAEVLQAVLCWLHYDLKHRHEDAVDILTNIRYNCISNQEFRILRRSPQYREMARLHPHLARFLHKCITERDLCCSVLCLEEEDTHCLVNPRGFEKAIVNVGGFQAHKGLTNDLAYYHLSSGRWRKLTSIPHVEQCDFGIAVLANLLYVVGGCFNQSLQEHIHPFGFQYDPRTDKWMTIAPMLLERCRFFLAAVDGKLYAVGGLGEHDDQGEFVSCECYNPATDMWESIAPLPASRMQHAGAVWGNEIFITGGLSPSEFPYDTMMAYDVEHNTWTSKADLLVPRVDHSMMAHRDNVYLAGGWYEDVTGNRVISDTVDCYNCQTDQWQVLTRIPTPRYHASMVVIGDILYVVGGFGAGQYHRASRKVETFSLTTASWQEHDEYPIEIWEHVSCALFVPRYRENKGYITEFEAG